MLVNSYFNINIKVPDNKKFSKECVLMQLGVYNSPFTFSGLSQQVIDTLCLDELLKYYNYSPNGKDAPLDTFHTLSSFKRNFAIFLESIFNGLKEPLHDKVIQNAMIFYPFVRISFSSKCFIITYFVSVEYIDGTHEFWITEAIPESEYLSKDFKTYNEYVDSSVFTVRSSTMFNTDVYTYLPKDVKFDHPSFSNGYILNEFIIENFGLDLSKFLVRIAYANNGVFNYNLSNKSNKHSLYFDIQEPIILIGIKGDKLDYSEYMREVLSKTYRYECVFSIYNKFIKLIDSSEISSLKYAQRQIMALFLDKMIKEDSLNLKRDVELVIKKESGYRKEDLIMLIMKACGAFFSTYNN